jgi:hypothetical protein
VDTDSERHGSAWHRSGEGINWKNIWLQGAGTTDDDLVIPNFHSEDSLSIHSNSLPYSKYFESQFSIGTWKRFAVYVDGGTGSNGAFHFWELTTSGVSQRINDNGVAILDASGYFEQVRINGYGRETANCYPTFDDVYIATGDNARARIEIGDNATYASCTKITVCTPESWSDTSISAKVWRGQFGATEAAYLFVIDSTGAVSSGHAITFGDTPAADTTPPTVTITTSDPQNVSTSSVSISWTDSDDTGVTARKWRIGSAPDASNGTTATSPATVTGLSIGANTVYIGAGDAAGNWGSDSITVNYTPASTSPTMSGATCSGCSLNVP